MQDYFQVYLFELPDSITKKEIAYLFKLYLNPDEVYVMQSNCITFFSGKGEKLGYSKITRAIRDMPFPAGVRLTVFRGDTPVKDVDTTGEPVYIDNENYWMFHNFTVKMKISDDAIYSQVKEDYLNALIK